MEHHKCVCILCLLPLDIALMLLNELHFLDLCRLDMTCHAHYNLVNELKGTKVFWRERTKLLVQHQIVYCTQTNGFQTKVREVSYSVGDVNNWKDQTDSVILERATKKYPALAEKNCQVIKVSNKGFWVGFAIKGEQDDDWLYSFLTADVSSYLDGITTLIKRGDFFQIIDKIIIQPKRLEIIERHTLRHVHKKPMIKNQESFFMLIPACFLLALFMVVTYLINKTSL